MNATDGLVLAVFIGMLLPLQALINAALGRQTFGPVFAALMSFAVGTVVLSVWWTASRPAFEMPRVGEGAVVGLDGRRDRRRLCRGRDACWSRAWARRR